MTKMPKTMFTVEEKTLLLEFVRDNSSIIENKSNDLTVIKAKKDKWIELSELFATNGYYRDWKRLREFYQRSKSNAKKLIINYQRGVQPSSAHDAPTTFDWAIYNICPEDFTLDESDENNDEDSNEQKNLLATAIVKVESILDNNESLNDSAPQDFTESLTIIKGPLNKSESANITASQELYESFRDRVPPDISESSNSFTPITDKVPKTMFTVEEKNLLLEFVKENAAIIENKSSDSKIVRAKQERWIELSDLFASVGYYRDWKRLREFYQRAKSNAKKVITNYQHGIQPSSAYDAPTALDWAIYEICPEDFMGEKNGDNFGEDSNQQISIFTSSLTTEKVPQSNSESSNTSTAQECTESLDDRGLPDISESSDTSAPLNTSDSLTTTAALELKPPRKKQKLSKFSTAENDFFKAQIKFLEERNRREQELHEAKMRVEQLKMRNEELIAEKLKLEIEQLHK